MVDGDVFDETNSTRMLFSSFGNKATVVCDDLQEQVRPEFLTLVPVDEFVETDNLPRLIQEGDIVLLAVDNHATRKLVSDFCATERRKVCLISGGNDGVEEGKTGREDGESEGGEHGGGDEVGADTTEGGARRGVRHALRGTYGNVQLFVRRDGEDRSPSLTRFHPEIAEPADHLPTDASCGEVMLRVPQLLFTNLATASAMLNAFWLYLCGASHYSELCFDICDGLMRPIAVPAPRLGASPPGQDARAPRPEAAAAPLVGATAGAVRARSRP
jgi:molybdopterin/thiamine biosynthesis adenylyltransferase